MYSVVENKLIYEVINHNGHLRFLTFPVVKFLVPVQFDLCGNVYGWLPIHVI